jgi:hypothetical protein
MSMNSDYEDDDNICETNKVSMLEPLFQEGFAQLSRLTAELTDLKMMSATAALKPGDISAADVLAAAHCDLDDLLAKVKKSETSLRIVRDELLENYVDEEVAEKVLAILDDMLVVARVISAASDRYNAIRQKIIESN